MFVPFDAKIGQEEICLNAHMFEGRHCYTELDHRMSAVVVYIANDLSRSKLL